MYWFDKVAKTNEDSILIGNLSHWRLLQKTRTENLKLTDRHADDGFDFLFRMRENSLKDEDEVYIMQIGFPLLVYMFSVKQIKALFSFE